MEKGKGGMERGKEGRRGMERDEGGRRPREEDEADWEQRFLRKKEAEPLLAGG